MKNNFKTAMLLAALGALTIWLGQAFLGSNGALIGLGIGLVFTFGSYWFSDKLAIAASRSKPVTEEQAPQLYKIMRELTTRANMPMPRMFVSPSPQPNAFATGRNDKRAAVAVTAGLLETLNEDELRGVLAHELMHIDNRDILIGSVAAAIAMGITFAARMAMWGAMFGGGSRDSNNGGGVIGLLAMMILAPIAAMVIQMAISRSREYEADRTAAILLGDGEPLARALEKLHASAKKIPVNVNPAQAQMYIVNPLSGQKVSFANMFSTHPPAEERINRLRSGNFLRR